MYASTRNGRSSAARPSSSPRTIVSSPPRWRPRTSASNVTVGSGSAMPGIIARRGQRRSHHRLGRPDRLRGGARTSRVGPRRRRHRQRHARVRSSAPRHRRAGAASGWSASSSEPTATSTSTSATAPACSSCSSSYGNDDRAGRPLRRAAVARLGRDASRSPTSTSTPAARSTCSRRRACTRPTRRSSSCRRTRSTATRPTALPLVELETRFEIDPAPPLRTTASARTCPSTRACTAVFGASKVAADVMVQEYGRYFGMQTACFRGGTLTGPQHSATELHGFLGYVMRCAIDGHAVHRLRLQGQAGARRDPQPRPDPRVRRVLPRAPRSPRSTTSAAGASATAPSSRRSRMRQEIAGRELAVALRRAQPDRRPHLVDRRATSASRPLSRLAPRIRRRADPRRDPRGRTRSAGRVIDARQAQPARRSRRRRRLRGGGRLA